MKAVGIKVLKDNLSKYLRQVRNGETILVTDRDEVIAEIHRPTHPVPGKVSRLQAFIEEEARRGSIIPALRRQPEPFSKLQEIPRPSAPIDLQGLLSEIKADQ
jgi:antitoxin (DNA-binding transcriptional repressor) of toxin-antitoxin stability system